MTIFYRLGSKLYVNITNNCPCACIFCIRGLTDSVGDAESLWLEREPSMEEIKVALDRRTDLAEIDEIVFCGYGEPMERAEDVIEIAQYMKKKSTSPVRLNTNGLVQLINPEFDIAKLAVMDEVSISLNADDAEEYDRITRPRFGAASYDEMLEFAKAAKAYTSVIFTVVDTLSPKRIENCRRIAQELGVPLRVRYS
ncbi:MAG: TatD family nuclease-associated radical SAM protein [Defluviitaleaceae bacterium]|nr:TatD family nuclease-associated radical SAM protein [Defluviitaleaceae bacterium]